MMAHLAVVTLVALATVALAGCDLFNPTPRDEQDLNYSTLDGMYAAADRVVRARLASAEEVVILDPDTGELLETVTYRGFVVAESFKGRADEGDTLNLVADSDLRFADGEGGAATLLFGDEYVLFLKGRARASQYPVRFGGTLWTLNGEPALARVEGGEARFLKRGDRAGFNSPVQVVTLAELRALGG